LCNLQLGFPLFTRKEYAGGCPAAAQRPSRSKGGLKGDFCGRMKTKSPLTLMALG
jgi:hypothetical protein